MTDCIQIGFGETDITPNRHRQTIYHRNGDSPHDSVPIRDRLAARATAFRKRDCLAVWVSLDVCVLSSRLRERIAAEFARRGIRADQLTVSSTHTHSAPTGHDFNGVEPMAEEYVDFLIERTADAMDMAVENAEPAEVFLGKATVDLSVNRREIGRMADINSLDAPSSLSDLGFAS